MEDEITSLQKTNASLSQKEYLNTLFLYKKKDIISLCSCILYNIFSFIFVCVLILLFPIGLIDKIVSFLGTSFYTVIILFAPLVCIALIENINIMDCISSIKTWNVIKKY